MDLKELLGEELYNQVIQKAGDNKIAIISDGSYIPKEKFNAINDQLKEYKTQATELKKITEEYETMKPQIEAMKTASSENPLLKQQLEDLQKKLETSSTQMKEYESKNQEWENRYKDTTLSSAIKLAALNAKAKDPEDILRWIDKSNLELNEDGSVKGLDEQLKTLTESKAYLFGQDTFKSRKPADGTSTQSGPINLEELAEKAKMSGRMEDKLAYVKAKKQQNSEQ